MRVAWLPSTRLGAAAAIAFVGACSYDFDQFARDKVAAATGSAGSGTSETGGASGGPSATTGGGSDSTSGGSGGMTPATTGTAGSAGTAGSGGSAGGSGGAWGGADAGNPEGGAASDAGDASLDGRGGASGSAGDASDAAPGDASADAPTTQDGGDAGFDCASLQGLVYQGHCYFPILGPFSWNLAATSCPFSAHLATITSAAEQAIAGQVLPNRDRWIGMRKDSNTPDLEASFYWVTTDSFVPGTSYVNWDLRDGGMREPNFSGDCVRMQFNSKWADDICTTAYPALCERE